MSNPGPDSLPLSGKQKLFNDKQTLVIGLLGGIASGKSLVAKLFAELGATVLNADRAGHEALTQPAVLTAARQRWGDAVFDDSGRINRAALAGVVFAPAPAGPQELAYLEQLTHPLIAQSLRQQINDASLVDGRRVVVLDAAVMIKAGWHKLCNRLVFVDAPREARLARAMARGWTAAEFDAREAAQETLDVKRGLADVMIDNSGSPEWTQVQVKDAWHSLVG